MTKGYYYDALNNTLTISASFAKKASKVGTLEYKIILKLRHDFPNLTIMQEEKKEGKKGLDYGTMAEFIDMHRNAKELKEQFERIKKLSRIQSMPYKYVLNWFESTFPYYNNPAIDDDGFVIDPATLSNVKSMVEEVAAGNTQEAMPLKAAA